jgi:hypothetical protein
MSSRPDRAPFDYGRFSMREETCCPFCESKRGVRKHVPCRGSVRITLIVAAAVAAAACSVSEAIYGAPCAPLEFAHLARVRPPSRPKAANMFTA